MNKTIVLMTILITILVNNISVCQTNDTIKEKVVYPNALAVTYSDNFIPKWIGSMPFDLPLLGNSLMKEESNMIQIAQNSVLLDTERLRVFGTQGKRI